MPEMLNKSRPLTSGLMWKVRAKMERESLSVADLARAIGKPRNYHQVYDWVVTEAFEPKAEIGFRLMAWEQGDAEALAKSISSKAKRKQATAA